MTKILALFVKDDGVYQYSISLASFKITKKQFYVGVEMCYYYE